MNRANTLPPSRDSQYVAVAGHPCSDYSKERVYHVALYSEGFMVTVGILATAISLFLLSPVVHAQSGSSTDIGNTTFFNSDGRSGTRQSIGNADFYTFSDGSRTTRSRIGSTDIYSGSTPSLSGSTNQIGNTTFGTWQDGTTSTHHSIGGTTFHKFSNGKTCFSNKVGSTTLTTCN